MKTGFEWGTSLLPPAARLSRAKTKSAVGLELRLRNYVRRK
jgi:hypothetical protein